MLDLLVEVADLKRKKRAIEVERDQLKNTLESVLKETGCATATELISKFDSLQRAYVEQQVTDSEATPQTEP